MKPNQRNAPGNAPGPRLFQPRREERKTNAGKYASRLRNLQCYNEYGNRQNRGGEAWSSRARIRMVQLIPVSLSPSPRPSPSGESEQRRPSSNIRSHPQFVHHRASGLPRLEQPRSGRAFTLIEMLVVIAVIGLSAALLVNLLPRAAGLKVRSRAKAELAQLETSIEAYKEKRGFYPPDNPSNPGTNSLYYELVGTSFETNSAKYTTLTGDGSAPLPSASISSAFGASGFVNSNTTSDGDARNFHPKLNILQQVKTVRVNGANVQLLGIAIRGPGGDFCPWYYNSSNPNHNPNGFDLWVEVLVSGKPKIFGNWKED